MRIAQFSVWGLPIGLGLLAFAGCSSSPTSGPLPAATAASDGGVEAGEPEDEPSTGEKRDGGGTRDAAPPRETEIVEVVTTGDGTCAKNCADEGYECTASCEYQSSEGEKVAGQAEYPETPFGQVVAGDLVSIATCSEPIDEKRTIGGEQRWVSTVRCCCERTKVIVEEGDPDSPKSCKSVCAAKSLVCDEGSFRDHTTGNAQGARLQYQNSTILAACSAVPKATHNGKTLSKIECGCVPP